MGNNFLLHGMLAGAVQMRLYDQEVFFKCMAAQLGPGWACEVKSLSLGLITGK